MKKVLLLVSVILIICLVFNACSSGKVEESSQDVAEETDVVENETTDLAEEQSEDSESESVDEPEAPTIVEPNIYEGSGDSVITLEPRDDVWVLYVKGNSESGYFGVSGYDASGKSTELFVNTTDVYEGITIDPSLSTAMLEINSEGKWHIEQRSIYTCDYIEQGRTVHGLGDDVLVILSHGLTASVKGNSSSGYFGVMTYGDGYGLLVNTTDPYEGEVMIKGDPSLLVVNSNSADTWEITFN